MKPTERAQQLIIQAHIQASMAYMHEMLKRDGLRTLARSAAHDAAAMVPFITAEGAEEIADTVEDEYYNWYIPMYTH